MAGVFELFHLSLLEQRQLDLYETPPALTREGWLRQCLGKRFAFEHRNSQVHWVPAETDTAFIIGNLVRSHPRRHHAPPEEGAMEVVSDEWQGAMVVIDPTHHEDGQKVSFERDETIGRPRPVLQSMATHLNALPLAPYAIEPKPIFSEASFWGWAAAHEFRLHSITFDFVVPNMWGSKNALDEDLKQLGSVGVSRVKVAMNEGDKKEGIDAQSQQVRDGVDYAAQGGGSLTAKAKNGDTFTSTNDAAIAKLPTTSAELSGGIKALTKWFPRLLGREQDDSLDGPAGSVDRPADG
jgi:hypothetical protein